MKRQLVCGLSVWFLTSMASTITFADIDTGLTALNEGNVAVAASEFQASFENGEGDGAFYLGRLFEFGLGTDADLPRAANLYAAGTERGSLLAMNRLGLLYLEGKTLLRDYKRASDYFCEAAGLGDQNGQLNCALMLRDGRGVEQDGAAAQVHLAGAAEQGNIAAQNILAQMLLNVEGGDVDQTRAIELFGQTADSGNAMGLFELAKFHATPAGDSEPDLVKAYSFANLATVRNHVEARVFRDDLEGRMTPIQVSEAQDMSQAWTAERIAQQASAASEN